MNSEKNETKLTILLFLLLYCLAKFEC